MLLLALDVFFLLLILHEDYTLVSGQIKISSIIHINSMNLVEIYDWDINLPPIS